MISLVVYCACVLAVTFVIGHSHLTFRPRQWLAARGVVGRWTVMGLQCPGCLGFWLGVLAALFGLYPLEALAGNALWSALLWAGLFTSGANLVLSGLANLGGEHP